MGAFADVRSNGLNYSEIHAGCEKGKHPQWSISNGGAQERLPGLHVVEVSLVDFRQSYGVNQ